MKCPNCGAEVTGDVCEYCGSRLSVDDINIDRSCCPKCGGKRVRFSLERRTMYSQQTVGFCQSCGYSWEISGNGLGGGFQNVSPEWILWLVGWVFFFPIPLTVLLLRAKTMPPVFRYGLIALLWIGTCGFFLLPILDLFFFF